MAWEEHLHEYLEFLKHKYNLNDEQVRAALLTEKAPIEIFRADLTPLQAVAHYLVQHRGKNVREIAQLLGRSVAEVEKFLTTKAPALPATGTHHIAVSAFADRKHSASEHLVLHLERQDMSVSEIAATLSKAEPTIWTLHYRIAKKGGAQ